MIEWKEGVSVGDWPIMSARFGNQQIVINNDEEGIYRYNYYVTGRDKHPERLAKGLVTASNWDVARAKVVQRVALALQEEENKARGRKVEFQLWVD